MDGLSEDLRPLLGDAAGAGFGVALGVCFDCGADLFRFGFTGELRKSALEHANRFHDFAVDFGVIDRVLGDAAERGDVRFNFMLDRLEPLDDPSVLAIIARDCGTDCGDRAMARLEERRAECMRFGRGE